MPEAREWTREELLNNLNEAHKPPAVIVQPVLKDEMLKDANKDDTEGDNIT